MPTQVVWGGAACRVSRQRTLALVRYAMGTSWCVHAYCGDALGVLRREVLAGTRQIWQGDGMR